MAEFTEKHHYKHLQLEINDRVGTITLNRPGESNSLNFDLIHELRLMFKEASLNDSIKVIILKANGNTFCSGIDLNHLEMLQKFSFEQNLQDANFLKELFLEIYKHPKVVIAQVEGDAIAEGCGLATACDFVYATPESNFAYSEVKIGFIPAIVMYFAIRRMGDARVREMLLSGAPVKAELAVSYGLINGVYPAEIISKEVQELAQRLVKENSAASMAMTKKMINDLPKLGLEEGMNFAAKMNAHARALEDCKKGIHAALNDEELNW